MSKPKKQPPKITQKKSPKKKAKQLRQSVLQPPQTSQVDMDFEHKILLAAWQRQWESRLGTFKATIEFGLMAIRSILLTNAGALAGVLGLFKSGMIKGGSIPFIVALFGLGLLLAVLGAGAAYFTQLTFGYANNKIELCREHPYLKEEKSYKWWAIIGHLVRVITIALLLASLVFLGWGGYLVYVNLTLNGEAFPFPMI